jgi:hypothetical protein
LRAEGEAISRLLQAGSGRAQRSQAYRAQRLAPSWQTAARNASLRVMDTINPAPGDRIDASADTAMIRGAGVEAHRIAALVEGGMPIAEVMRDYPGLTRAQVEAAVAYARAYPKQGHPFPGRSVKSVLRQGRGGLGKAFLAACDAR